MPRDVGEAAALLIDRWPRGASVQREYGAGYADEDPIVMRHGPSSSLSSQIKLGLPVFAVLQYIGFAFDPIAG